MHLGIFFCVHHSMRENKQLDYATWFFFFSICFFLHWPTRSPPPPHPALLEPGGPLWSPSIHTSAAAPHIQSAGISRRAAKAGFQRALRSRSRCLDKHWEARTPAKLQLALWPLIAYKGQSVTMATVAATVLSLPAPCWQRRHLWQEAGKNRTLTSVRQCVVILLLTRHV